MNDAARNKDKHVTVSFYPLLTDTTFFRFIDNK